MAPPDALKALRAADWKRIYPALVAYAFARSARLYLVKGGGRLPEGHEPTDVADEAVRLVYEGERKWDPNAHPDLLRYLSGVVSSLVSNLITGADHTWRVDGADGEPSDLDEFEGTVAPSPLASTESDECVEVLRAIVDQETEGDEGLATVAMGLEDEMRPAEIADMLSIDVKEAYLLIRKLRRRLYTAMADHECWEDHPMMTIASRP
ncbi:MAG TPA: hypothetical protein EYQ24_04190 [Bacteroidetes bacterium]|nr:hypothetical protein [Bacteroidota bacterium]